MYITATVRVCRAAVLQEKDDKFVSYSSAIHHYYIRIYTYAI